MQNHPVIITPQAQEDLIEIWLYIVNESQDEQIAERTTTKVTDFCFERLAYFPEMGRERKDLRNNVRYYPVGNYLIFYSIDNATIYIERVIHSSQDYQKHFL